MTAPDQWVPWHPVTDPVHVKYMVKPVEELGELVSIIARTVIQGWDGIDPKTKKPNRQCLEDEIADVEASNELLKEKFNLDRERIDQRKKEKIGFLRPLHEAAGQIDDKTLSFVDQLATGELKMLSINDITKRLKISRSTFERWRRRTDKGTASDAGLTFPAPDLVIGRSGRWREETLKTWLRDRTPIKQNDLFMTPAA